jgi:hypothetical protein
MVAETGEKGNLTLTVHLLKYSTINQNPKHDVRDQQEAREDTTVKENAEGITRIAARSVTNFFHLYYLSSRPTRTCETSPFAPA